MKRKIIIIIVLLLAITSIGAYIVINKLSNSNTTGNVNKNENTNVDDESSIKEEDEIKIENVDDPYIAREDYLEFTNEDDALEFNDTSNETNNTGEEFQDPINKTNEEYLILDPDSLPDNITIDENGKISIDLSNGDNRTPTIHN